jgi:thiamine transport system substrate-binding protein
MNYRAFLIYFSGLILILFILFLPYLTFDNKLDSDENSLRILSYSSFLEKWAAGPEIAQMFFEKTGIKVHWINAGNAGLLLERLKFKKNSDLPDLVIGLDQYSIYEAQKIFNWQNIKIKDVELNQKILPFKSYDQNFLAYDWAPLTFVYHKNHIQEPQTLEDLLNEAYKDKIILLDPRMSSPGLQFLFWVIQQMGEDQAFKFFEKLKPSVKIMAPSWSNGYSLFKLQQSTMIFSYYTSPYYHQLEENSLEYKAASFKEALPIQVEYAAIPSFCKNCEAAQMFASFLLSKEAQSTLMKKNYMFPIYAEVLEGSSFKLPESLKFYDPQENLFLMKKKKEIIKRWKKIFY